MKTIKRYIGLTGLAMSLCLCGINAQTPDGDAGSSAVKNDKYAYCTRDEAFGRRDKNHIAHYTVTFQFTELFNDGDLRFNFCYRLPHSRSWIEASVTTNPFSYDSSPKYNQFESSLSGDEYASRIGYGIDLNYRWYFSKLWYLSAGLYYRFYNVKYFANGWYTFEEDGLQYKEHREEFRQRTINKPGVNLMIGLQKMTRHSGVFDFYVGIGARWGMMEHDPDMSFDNGLSSMAYWGLTPTIGARFGFGKYWKRKR